jgi:hypothetical protein
MAECLSQMNQEFIYQVIDEGLCGMAEDSNFKVRYRLFPMEVEALPLEELCAMMMVDFKAVTWGGKTL